MGGRGEKSLVDVICVCVSVFESFQCDSQHVEPLFCFGFPRPRKASLFLFSETDFPLMTKFL